MRRVAILVLAVAAACACACGGSGGPPLAAAPQGAALERLLVGADDARARAARGDASLLDCCFAGPALLQLRRQAAEVVRRGGVEERPLARRLVHSDPVPGGVEAVLEVRSEARPLGAPAGIAAARIERQWWTLLRPAAAGWRIEDDHDLPPDRWWRT